MGKRERADGEPVYRAVRPRRLFEQIAEQIEESIVSGQLKPGDQLPGERELTQRFGASRTAVREAIKTVREKGLVEAYSGRGTFVKHGAAQAIGQTLGAMARINQREGTLQLAELRQMLEPEIAARAATRIDEKLLSRMHEAVAVMDLRLGDADAYVDADRDFHLALAEGMGNPLMLSLVEATVGLLEEQRRRVFKVEGGPERVQEQHRKILAAVEKHDGAGAREAMRAHLVEVLKSSGQWPVASP